MKSFKALLIATALTMAYFPLPAGAFGFGASQYRYSPGPWGPYGPYPPQAAPRQGQASPAGAPFAPPPNARNVRGMWGSGPGMSWGGDRETWYKEIEKRRQPHWELTKDWVYTSPYEEPAKAAPSK